MESRAGKADVIPPPLFRGICESGGLRRGGEAYFRKAQRVNPKEKLVKKRLNGLKEMGRR